MLETFAPGEIADAADFQARVVARCQPAILRGLARDWPLTDAAASSSQRLLAYLHGLDAGATAEAFVGDRAIAGRYYYDSDLTAFNFSRLSAPLATIVARIVATAGVPDEPTIYAGSLPTDLYLPTFATDNAMPLVPASARPRLWIGHGSTVACHHDNFDNLACVAAGRRRFTLFPPDAIGDLYVGPIDHTMAGQPVAMAVGAPPDDPRFPRFGAARARALTVELEPGDALYLPKLWWHQVEALSPLNILVNYWWDASATGPDTPYTAMLLAIATIAERPPAERAAWRAFFDHYAFRPDGHPLAHLPEERHGILAAGRRGQLRAAVMRLLRGA
ncbi:cupin-like domain-containing protein [Sphingomonas sp. 8AM]|uniref:cupin-like domain-containing protein n=1 Tax=Sphingomonas sp. 8AM TaxID=2653170 RepID=UPI0012F45954|nr:cupin-like domain-containing protein [Sphingomonas sp. 8AM]VXD01638.1 Cupin-like domain-containing protein [Sphingomonas sp. 8AM]